MKLTAKITTITFTIICLAITGNTYADSKTKSATLSNKQTTAKPQQEPSLVSGKVIETFNSGGYTYLLLEKKNKKIWAAVPAIKTTVGQEITLLPGYEMHNFKSKSLNRNFESIIFSAGTANLRTGNSASKILNNEKIKVSKASGPNAYTVNEIYEKRAILNTKNIAVRGKVVKVSSNIMGKNWIHLQDGTGNVKQGSNDLVITSNDLPKEGDIVTANGTLCKDKDFGAGYKYAVIMEKASVKK